MRKRATAAEIATAARNLRTRLRPYILSITDEEIAKLTLSDAVELYYAAVDIERELTEDLA